MAVLEYSPGLLGFNMANDNTARVITTDHVVRVTLTDGTDYQLRATKDEDGVLHLQTKLSREALGLPPARNNLLSSEREHNLY